MSASANNGVDAAWDFTGLRALFINCTLKPSPQVSNTRALGDLSAEIMRRQGVAVEVVRALDEQLATGVQPDMTEHGAEQRRLAGAVREGDGIRHPGAAHPDLAG